MADAFSTLAAITTGDHAIDHSPQGHFRLYLHRLIARMLQNITQRIDAEALDSLLTSFAFLAALREQLEALPIDALLAEFEAAYPAHLPLRALRNALELDDHDLLLLLAAGIIEEDVRFGAVFAALQHPLNSRRPCLGMLGWLLAIPGADTADTNAFDAWTLADRLARHGLIEIVRDDALVHQEWTVRVPLPIWAALRGDMLKHPTTHIQRQPADMFPLLDALILPDDIAPQVAQLPAMIANQQIETLVLRGMTGSGRRTTIGALARSVGRDVLLASQQLPDDERRMLGALASLTHAIPLLRLAANPGETITLDRLPGYRGLLGVSMGRFGGIDGSTMDNALSLTLRPPNRAGRQQFWAHSGVMLHPPDADAIVDQCLLTGGRIHHVARLARTQARLGGRPGITLGDVQAAQRAVNRQALETLATPLGAVAGWAELAVHSRTDVELRMLEARCRGREHLLDHVGAAFDNNLNRGVRALFNGPSGTGKTYAARALAGALQMDLYRVDLANIVNKYIGETEKNLNRVFTYAEELDVILLLDEGDSLMTRRTDVGGANDRYANLETNYLLQRLENYEGIIVVTSNAAQRIDQAFMRRLDVVIEFTPPGAEQRRRLWHAHLPEAHAVSTGLLERVIARCDLTGGQIRNVALYASLLGLHHGRPVGDDEFEVALQREYHIASLPYPLA